MYYFGSFSNENLRYFPVANHELPVVTLDTVINKHYR